MPKEIKKRNKISTNAHNPLGQVIDDDENRKKYAKNKIKPKKNKNVGDDEDEDAEPLMDERTSRRILELSREQQLEEDAQEAKRLRQKEDAARRGKTSLVIDDSSDEDEDNDGDESILIQDEIGDFETTEVNKDAGYVTVHGEGLSAEEEAVVASMMGGRASEERKSLADVILNKIALKENQSTDMNDDEKDVNVEELPDLPPKVVEVYTDIGKILSRYRAGKLPKAFKVIPSLSNWEEVLYLTRPDLWSPNAMYAATRIFASNLNPKMAQRFYNLVLLDAVRADIVSNHRLNYHYYMALKKAVYKPAAFFKGILIPLCKENCTLREAAIVSSVMQRVSIPVHHSAVAIHKLAQMEQYSGAASIFIKTLLNKKYSLPAPVIGSMVRHFAGFLTQEKIVLPVLWHQCLLVFVQRYKNEVKDEAREQLRQVMKVHCHPKITPEIRRELFGAQALKEERMAIMGKNNDRNEREGGLTEMET